MITSPRRRRPTSRGLSWWMPQIFGFESLSVLAIVGLKVPGIELGTAVVPTCIPATR